MARFESAAMHAMPLVRAVAGVRLFLPAGVCDAGQIRQRRR